MRRKLLVGCALLCVTLSAGIAWVAWKNTIAAVSPEGFKLAAVQPTGAFQSEASCFHVGGYDAFIGRIRARNSAWKPKLWLLPWIFPRESYEHAQATLDCRSVSYTSDGLAISGWMVAPKRPPGTRLPVLIFNRGGNGGFGALTLAGAMMQLFPYAQEGFLVLASNYRGLEDDHPLAEGQDEFGGADVRDVERLLALVDRIPQADSDNVFMLGVSRGVMMSYLVARHTDRIRAIAAINGDADLELSLAFRPEMEQVYSERMPEYATRKSELLAQRSVLRWAEELPRGMPILMLHGGDDERVDPTNGPRLKRRLDAIGHPNKLVTYADDDHFLRKNRDAAVAEVVAWFRTHAMRAATAVTEASVAVP
jgi:dipeptidyl aminopeptidase/acylaminoacyl peptidase